MSKELDPQGSPALFVLENNRYVIVYFGGAQAGSWKMVRDSFVVFISYIFKDADYSNNQWKEK